MVILGSWQNKTITLSIKENCLTLSLPTEAEADVFSTDYEGRLWTALEKGIAYRRGLDGKVVAKWQTPQGRERCWLSQAEGLALEGRARQRIIALYEAIQSGEAKLDQPLPAKGIRAFQAAIAFNESRSLDDAARYHQVYKPVGILPPDQYFSIVLQATEGCSFNSCTFCTFYRDRPFRVKDTGSFRAHARAVKDFIGAGMSLRRTIFLGDANALVVPMPRLMSLFEIVHQEFDVEALGGIYAFLDGFSGERKSVRDYAQLASQGLKRVYIGMESGNDQLLHFLNKPGKAADAVQAVKALKAAGVAVGIIVLLGAGGNVFAKKHVEDTIRTLNAMPLDLHDLIYFSELVDQEGMEYTRDAYHAKLQPLTSVERLAQGDQIERRLKFNPKGGTPHIARYDIREFVY